jgi:hypothetical protein
MVDPLTTNAKGLLSLHVAQAGMRVPIRWYWSSERTTAVAAGLDPYVGYLHACRPGRVALVYDLMEPLRPVVDRAVLQFARSQTFTPSDFVLTEKGIRRLNPQLARAVATINVHESIDRVVEWFSNELTQKTC